MHGIFADYYAEDMAEKSATGLESLSQDEQHILEVLSFCFRTVSVPELVQLLNEAKIPAQSGRTFKKEDVDEVIARLMKNKFVTSPIRSSYASAEAYRTKLRLSFASNALLNKRFLLAFSQVFKLNQTYSYWFTENTIINSFSYLNQVLLIGDDTQVMEATAKIRQLQRLTASQTSGQDFVFLCGGLLKNALAYGTIKRLDADWVNEAMVNYSNIQFFLGRGDAVLFDAIEKSGLSSSILDIHRANTLFLTGRFDELLELNSRSNLLIIKSFAVWVQHLRGENVTKDLEQILQMQAISMKTKQEFFLTNCASYWQVPYSLIQDKSKLVKANKFLKDSNNTTVQPLRFYTSFIKNIGVPNGSDAYYSESYGLLSQYQDSIWSTLIHGICAYWIKVSTDKYSRKNLEDIYNDAVKSGSKYLQAEIADLLSKMFELNEYSKIADKLQKEMGIRRSISDLYTPPSDWELKLNMLADFAGKADKKTSSVSEERLIWLIGDHGDQISPVLQKQLKSGAWSKGRAVALSRLKDRLVECMTAYDEPVLAHLKISNDYYRPEYYWEMEAITALVGHPLLFMEKAPEVPIELESEEIELIVEESKGKCTFSFSHDITEDLTLVKYGTNRYRVITAGEGISNIARIIGKGLVVPKDAKPKVLETLKQLSGSIRINSPLIGEQTGAQLVQASSRMFVHMLPLGSGIKADIYVKPLDPEPPYLRPAEGLKKITGHRDGMHIWSERDFAAERSSLKSLLKICPIFGSQAEEDGSAIFDEPSECLQVLSEFREAGDQITIEWPRGQKFSIKTKVSLQNFSLRVKKKNTWFDLQGDVSVDDEQMFSLMKMIELLDTAKNRFVEIEPGVFIELEKHFIRQLEYLKTVADVDTNQIRLHPLAALSNAGLFDSAGSFTSDSEWNEFIANIKKSESSEYPLPKGLQAELRPYQLEGYQWLRKMFDWGTGACLADDMGLGKTLQCIALLLSRASEGPSMVVAPTSVCRNWMNEIEKFAPGLVPILFGSAERKNTVETIDAGGVLIVSYGLLATEAELLASRSWNVFILDEAHAIKNMATKRSQVAMSINAMFRIAATGTPLQNHMGELWNLFQFLNPGLLGSQQAFSERFVIPIEKSNNEIARSSLKDLIKPFILRRTKNQVLHDLPEKTEITMSVDLSPQERTFYEALRVKALEEIQRMDGTVNSGEKQIRVLAEIMKLRMACCHTTLANKDINIESSKLARFEELVDHLIENGHKALVFSQFIGHLSLMREMLDRKSISYEYLDGSTPQREREERIGRFQKGGADLFLISLKAGGVGLNLTAADYVIHMDPWWNPAVEDQASDRAHRIGQTKPVTIYRLVTKDTIEDKIVDLHRNKRDLADSLLEGTEAAAKVTADELIGLLKGL